MSSHLSHSAVLIVSTAYEHNKHWYKQNVTERMIWRALYDQCLNAMSIGTVHVCSQGVCSSVGYSQGKAAATTDSQNAGASHARGPCGPCGTFITVFPGNSTKLSRLLASYAPNSDRTLGVSLNKGLS